MLEPNPSQEKDAKAPNVLSPDQSPEPNAVDRQIETDHPNGPSQSEFGNESKQRSPCPILPLLDSTGSPQIKEKKPSSGLDPRNELFEAESSLGQEEFVFTDQGVVIKLEPKLSAAISEDPCNSKLEDVEPKANFVNEVVELDSVPHLDENSNATAEPNSKNIPDRAENIGFLNNSLDQLHWFDGMQFMNNAWRKYTHHMTMTHGEDSVTNQFKIGIAVFIGGIVAVVVCITVGLKSNSVACKNLLTIGTIVGTLITSIGGIWMTAAQPSSISKTKIAVVIASLIGIGAVITTTMEQLKDYSPEPVNEPVEKLVYSPTSKKTYRRSKSLPMALYGAVADKHINSGLIMVAGGRFFTKDSHLSIAFLYDEYTQNTTFVHSMTHQRVFAAGGWIGDIFIMCGGESKHHNNLTDYKSEDYTSSCEGYNMSTDGQWFTLASMPKGLAETAFIINDTYMYIFGGSVVGSKGHLITDQAAVYSFKNDSWSTLKSMPEPRILSAAIVYQDEILICGGYNHFSQTACYLLFNLSNQLYTQIEPLVYARYAFVLIFSSTQKVLAIGGQRKQGDLIKTVEMFDGKYWLEYGPS